MELNEETLREILREQRDQVSQDFKRHMDEGVAEIRHEMGLWAEHLEDKIESIAEGHDALRQELGGVRDQLTDLQERVTRIEGYTAAIRDMAAKNSQDVTVIRMDIEAIKSDIAAVRRDLKDKAGRDELAAMELRVGELERTLRSR